MRSSLPHRACAALVVGVLVGLCPTAQAALITSGSFGTSEYQVMDAANLNWLQAEAAAEALGPGWHLVTVTSAAEQAFLVGLLNGANIGSGQLWAGGWQPVANFPAKVGWEWITGESWVFSAWANDDHAVEPNDNFGPGSESYQTLDNRWERNWTWNDETLGSRDRLGFVAERTVVPAPPVVAGPVIMPEPTSLALFTFAAGVWAACHCRRRAA